MKLYKLEERSKRNNLCTILTENLDFDFICKTDKLANKLHF